MPYHYLEDVAPDDVAFKAQGKTLNEMFVSAAEATMNVMVEDLSSIAKKEKKTISLEVDNLDLLLIQFLQELIYYKDAERLLLRIFKIDVSNEEDFCRLSAQAYGEPIDSTKHKLNTDVKAVTFHQFKIVQNKGAWEATVILDL